MSSLPQAWGHDVVNMSRVLICAHTFYDNPGAASVLVPMSSDYAQLLLERVRQVDRLGEFGLDPILQYHVSSDFGDEEEWIWMSDLDIDDFVGLGDSMKVSDDEAIKTIKTWIGACIPSILPDEVSHSGDDDDFPFNTVLSTIFRVDTQTVKITSEGVRFCGKVYPLCIDVESGELAKEVLEEIAKNDSYSAFPATLPAYRR